MKGLLFLGIILVVLLVAAIGLSKEKEGFVNPGSNASLRAPQVIVPKVDPAYGPLEGTTPGPYVPPTEKTYGPAFGEQSRVNTLPYKNPELESAKFQRVAELLESLKGFFSFEAESLSKQSDPVVQLPLTTARGDLQRLKDEVDVLKRNPGMDSSLTQAQVDEIQANLAYLQRRFRLSVNSASGLKEGFESDDPTQTETSEPQDKGRRLSLEEIQGLRTAVSVEIVRLSASGTTDPVTVARVDTLTNIQNALDSLMKEVQTGVRPESEIPIYESDKTTFLPAMSDPSKPLPQLIQDSNLPPSVANLFPAYGPGNITGSKVAQTLFAQYGDALFKGLSWDADLRLKYTSQNEVDASRGPSLRKAKEKVGLAHKYSFGVGSKDDNSTENSLEYKSSEDSSDDYSFPRGEMEQYSVDMDSTRVEGKPPAKFDWKQRTNDICTNIKKTGLKPGDFGCIPTTTKVSLDFSWRGVARMVCSRLLTTPDPGLPEQCGCPPLNWPGWRS